MNVNSLVLVNGYDENGTNYKNEPAVILVVSDNTYLVKFIRTHLGIHHYLHGDNTAEISSNFLRPTSFDDVVRITNMDSNYVNYRINAIKKVPPLSIGDLVIVNGHDTMGRNHVQVPAILVSYQNNQFIVRFLSTNETYTFLDRGSLQNRNKITQLDEIAEILGTDVDDVKNLILGITYNMNNLPYEQRRGGRKKSFKKRSYNRKRYNSFKKVSNFH